MMNWQQWAVAILLLLCIVRIGWGIYAFSAGQRNGNPCANCVTGCDLKRLMDEKRAECSATKKKRRKMLRIVGVFKNVLPLQPQMRKDWFLG